MQKNMLLNYRRICFNIYKLVNYSTESSKVLHVPVMLNEVLKYLVEDNKTFKVYLDMTFGAGGHSEAILKSNPNSIIYASDRDPRAFKLAQEMAEKYP